MKLAKDNDGVTHVIRTSVKEVPGVLMIPREHVKCERRLTAVTWLLHVVEGDAPTCLMCMGLGQ